MSAKGHKRTPRSSVGNFDLANLSWPSVLTIGCARRAITVSAPVPQRFGHDLQQQSGMIWLGDEPCVWWHLRPARQVATGGQHDSHAGMVRVYRPGKVEPVVRSWHLDISKKQGRLFRTDYPDGLGGAGSLGDLESGVI